MYINRNTALTQIEELRKVNTFQNHGYIPNDLNKKQKKSLELFQKRIFLEEIIEETISFNKKLNWENFNKNLKLTTTAEALINVFKLRSNIYTAKGYQNEFKDEIEGLNFDKYDEHSAILYYQTNNEISGSIRLIFDEDNFLPTEKNFSLAYLRDGKNKIGELSRQVVKQTDKGLGLEFKNFYKGIYEISMNNLNKINLVLASITSDHYKLYSKFGGMRIEKELNSYGNLTKEILVLSWDIKNASSFFKKLFLK